MISRLAHRLAAIACFALLATLQARPCVARPELPDTLTLRSALDLALIGHPDLRVAAAELAAARAESSFARVPAFNPELELQSARGGRTLGSGSEATLDVGVSQEFELWGKRAARQSVASARAHSSSAALQAKLQEVESGVRARFEHALYLQHGVVIVAELAELDRRVVAATQARVRDGSITPVTGRLTELDLLKLEAQGRRGRAEFRQALVALSLAIGTELPESMALRGDVQADTVRAPEDSIVAMALRVRATGEALARQIATKRAELHLAEREARPNITLGVGVSRERRAFSGEDFAGDPAIVGGIAGATSTDKLWTARVSAPIPLWQKNQAGRAQASAGIAQAQAEYDRYQLQTRLEVVGAIRRFADATALYRLYLERSTHVRQDLVLIHEAYADGRIPLDSYLTQKGRLVDTLLGQLDAGDGYWDARAQLETAVGLDLADMNTRGAR